VSCAKTVEPIEMPFELWPWIGPKNQVLDGVQAPMERGNFERGRASHCEVYERSVVSCAKTAEPDRDAVWDLDSSGPTEACIMWRCTLALPGEHQ